MFTPNRTTTRCLIAGAAASAAIAFAGCGSDDKATKDLQKQGQKLQQQGAALQKQAQQTAADVKSGKISAAAAQKKLDAGAKKIEATAKETSKKAIDDVKNNPNLTAAQKQQLEDAKKQIDQAP